MPERRVTECVEGFHHPSYLVGINVAFIEVVANGCKRLALSSPLTEEQYQAVWGATEAAAIEYGTHLLVERDLLETRLFPADTSRRRIVILIAHDEGVLSEYRRLKEEMCKHMSRNTLTDEIEVDIAHRFGRLLSYDEDSIQRLLGKRTRLNN